MKSGGTAPFKPERAVDAGVRARDERGDLTVEARVLSEFRCTSAHLVFSNLSSEQQAQLRGVFGENADV